LLAAPLTAWPASFAVSSTVWRAASTREAPLGDDLPRLVERDLVPGDLLVEPRERACGLRVRPDRFVEFFVEFDLVCAIVLLLFVPAELALALAGAFFVELRLDLSALRPLLGDRGLGATLFRPLTVVACVVVLRLGLDLTEFAAPAGPPDDRGEDR
jgi:hypothetical protein